jgi:hypothetical protein
MAKSGSDEVQDLIKRGLAPQVALDFVAALDAFELQVGRLAFNVGRVEKLVSAATELRPKSVLLAEDVLRSAVVLLHASLEDYLRTLAGAYLKFAPRSALNGIPLAGHGRERPEKFLLGALADYRERSVLELIALSIEEHLERKTYNNIEDIVALLQDLGCELDELRPYFRDLEEMIGRRHIIVHRADLATDQLPRAGSELGKIEEIDVTRWAKAVQGFASLTTKRVTLARFYVLVPNSFRDASERPTVPGATDVDS